MMNVQKISTWLRNTGTVATLVAISALATGLLAPAASAFSLVPNEEGEVDVGMGCYADCIGTDSLIESIESLVDSSSGEKSLLFVDNLLTFSEYHDGAISLGAGDVGTNPGDYFFRPVTAEEAGQLEVGTFKFNFTKTLKELTVDFFDVETWYTTGVLEINDVEYEELIFGSDKIGNDTLNSMTFYDVDSIVLKLGTDFEVGSGDGVAFRMSAKVPEPSVVLGLGAVAVMGGLGLRKRRK